MKYLFSLLAISIGCFVAIQGTINTQLTAYLKHPLQGALVNFVVGTLCLVGLNLLFRTQLPEAAVLRTAPSYLFVGGILGAIGVSSLIFLVPKIGITTVLAAMIAGQLISAAIIDHFGLLGVTPQPITLNKIVGIVFLVVGVLFIQKR